MFILKVALIFIVCLNISNSYASNIKNSAVVFMYHKFGIDKYPTTSVTLDQFDSHLKEFSREKYSLKSILFFVNKLSSSLEFILSFDETIFKWFLILSKWSLFNLYFFNSSLFNLRFINDVIERFLIELILT